MVFEMRGIVKRYGDLLANDEVSIHLNKGEILAIVGENGAGKSTIMKILYGLERPTAGEIYVNGRQVHFHTPSDAMAVGIGMVQQHFMLFEPMTVAENIVFHNEIKRGPFLDKARTIEAVAALSDKYQLKIDPEAIVADCPVGLRQRVEILKILYQNAEIIIFDEPSAVLTPLEVDALLEKLRQLANMGKSIVLITHKLNEVMNVADRVYVMRAGRVVAERQKADTSIDELSYLMVGRHLMPDSVPAPRTGERLLEAKELSLFSDGRELLRKLSLHVDAGEIVGIAGVSGNGQSELSQILTGLRQATGGRLIVGGKDVTGKSVKQIRDAGLSYIPEDRFVWGGAPDGTLSENALMGLEDSERFCKRGFLNWAEINAYATEMISRFDVKASSPAQRLRELSGGNAQKLIVAREMMLSAPLIISCEPTRGVDVGAMEFIHRVMLKKREEGGGVLLISSELSEIIKLSDRIYVMFEGGINGEFRRGQMDDKQLGLLMVGGRR